MWSVWQPDRNVFFNSYFLERDGGNIVVDPLAWTPQDEAQMRERGGVTWIVITNRDHERRTRDLAALFDSKIAASERDAPLLSGPVDLILREAERVRRRGPPGKPRPEPPGVGRMGAHPRAR